MSKKSLNIFLVALLVIFGGFVVYVVIDNMLNKDYPVTINKIDVNEVPEKVISLSPNLTNFIILNGYDSKLVGVSNYCVDIDGKIQSLPRLGSAQSPSVNEIVSIKPNYVLTSTPINEILKAEIEKNGITVLEINTSSNYDGFNNYYKDLFYLFDGKTEGQKKLTDYVKNKEALINNLKARISIPENQTFAILPIKDIFSDSNTVESKFLEQFLGENVISENVSKEEDLKKVIESNPSLIIAKQGEDISALSDTDAYKNNKIYYISFSGFEQNNYYMIYDDIKEICKNIYGVEETQPEKENHQQEEQTSS